MANIAGTNIAAPVVPFTTEDSYETHHAKYGKGGYRSVQDILERDMITTARREEGMEVLCIANGTRYRLEGGVENSHWAEVPNTTALEAELEIGDVSLVFENALI